MARSKREIPHYYLQTTVDVSGTLAWLQRENERRPLAERLLLAGVLIRAVALAARDVPGFNGFYEAETFTPSEPVNVGVAISLRDGGLVTPAVLGTEALPLNNLMAALLDLVSRARANRLRASEMAGGTITVTNLGDQGIELVYGVIYPPQVAILGFGRPVERPWAEGGLLGVRTVLTATLAADHRVTNGHRGGQFLNAVTRYIQHPELL
jgi:pyruvate dehydrogenase E2 component (dihydrolipoamide acetyltransferase)